ncbi:hypothetical protein H0H87_008342, partial [Tephrocybe sp. NHM501043]
LGALRTLAVSVLLIVVGAVDVVSAIEGALKQLVVEPALVLLRLGTLLVCLQLGALRTLAVSVLLIVVGAVDVVSAIEGALKQLVVEPALVLLRLGTLFVCL